jgi:hypothetical protein
MVPGPFHLALLWRRDISRSSPQTAWLYRSGSFVVHHLCVKPHQVQQVCNVAALSLCCVC